MLLDQLAVFAIFALVTSITPGPNNIMLAATGANVGIRRGLPHMFGISIGFALMIFLVAAGAGSVLLDNPAAMRVLRVIGIAVLLWLAWKIATARRTAGGERERPIGFFGAAAFQWVNPKAWLICAGAVGGFLQSGAQSPLPQAMMFALVFIAVGAPCMLAWLRFGAAMQRLLTSERAYRAFNVTMGVLLASTVIVMV